MDKIEIPARDEGKSYPVDKFPAYCTSPSGEGEVFNSEGEVPAGWTMPDGTVKGGKAKAPASAPSAPVATTETASTSEELDADGWAWNPELHAATKTKTSAGLWRMKVGVSRPSPKTTAPLDL